MMRKKEVGNLISVAIAKDELFRVNKKGDWKHKYVGGDGRE